MSDQPNGRPGNTGDGDNYDPEVHDPDVSRPADAASSAGRADGSVGQGPSEDGADRASEIDDVTEGSARPDADAEQALADAVDEIDISDVDVFAVLDERDQFKSMAQRTQADFDNFRKQSAVRAQADADRATGRLAEALLPVLDAAEAAYVNHPAEIGPLLNQMLVELRKQGLETLDLDGQPFDPEVAEAVAHEPGDGGEALVSEVLRSGYRWKGRTLRPAMVKTTD
ncbi:nucleotide exchange factor GrpE [Ilumatobacter nonamiensis]|uniref:nucleotide exchange factor GrpE n=1 Tax=Ilumatobacter nonamiensis TaxID=467093 RepID=UPI00034DCC8D|nr:nucleotide exchange factor GrpE [Ilumatobacter nonamiensis]